MTEIDVILADDDGSVLTLEDGTALLVDWFTFDGKPASIIEARIGRVWHELQCDIEGFTATIGRDLTTQPVEAGVAQISLSNRGGQYSHFTDGQPSLAAGTEIRLRVISPTVQGTPTERVVWHGFVQEWAQEWTATVDRIWLTAVDAIALLAEQGGSLGWTSGTLGDSVFQRLDHLLERVGLTTVATYFDPGDTRLINPEIIDATVLDEAYVVSLTDGGRFFAEPTDDGYAFVYLDRSRFAGPPTAIAGFALEAPSSQTVAEPIAPERIRVLGNDRPAQGDVPLFSDLCSPESDGLPYVDLGWTYRGGWEHPSMVAVSNAPAPIEHDRDGVELEPRWGEIGAIATTGATRHRITEFTDLELSTQGEANALAELYASVLARSNIDVYRLVVVPELDQRLWATIGELRQGDWVMIERHLQTHRLLATCAIEGLEWSLTPPVDGGEPTWKVTYRLHSLSVITQDIPPELRPPRPPGFPGLKPPLPPAVPAITLNTIDILERGHPAFQVTYHISDPDHAAHILFVWNEHYGGIELPITAGGSYVVDEIARISSGTTLAPGTWLGWVQEAGNLARTSNQLSFVIDPWAEIDITAVTFNPASTSIVRYSDGRYPGAQPRAFVKDRQGVEELAVTGWRPVGDPDTTNIFELNIETGHLLAGSYELWVQDPTDADRKSNIWLLDKATPVPGGLKLGPFSPPDYAADQWSTVPLVWAPVPHADSYRITYIDAATGQSSTRTSTVATLMLPGGRVSGGQQTERQFEVTVTAVVNAQESGPSSRITIETGYPYLISKSDYHQTMAHQIRWRHGILGGVLETVIGPSWAQDTNPSGDNFVGLAIDKLRVLGLDARDGGTHHDRLMWNADDDRAIDGVHSVVNGLILAVVPSNPKLPDPSVDFRIEYIGSGGTSYGISPVGTAFGPVGGPGSRLEGSPIIIGDRYTYSPPKYPVQL